MYAEFLHLQAFVVGHKFLNMADNGQSTQVLNFLVQQFEGPLFILFVNAGLEVAVKINPSLLFLHYALYNLVQIVELPIIVIVVSIKVMIWLTLNVVSFRHTHYLLEQHLLEKRVGHVVVHWNRKRGESCSLFVVVLLLFV